MPTIYPARRVLTLNARRPTAEAVAVEGDRVLETGALEDLLDLPRAVVDDRFRDHVLIPGFVEAHSHVMAGGMWSFCYVGYFDRRDPSGRLWPGCKSIGAVLERLRDAASRLSDPAQPLQAWGLDPIYFPGERLVADHLDQVSRDRPIFVHHASGHLATVNRALLVAEGISDDLPTPGLGRNDDGTLDGELREPPAMMLAREAFGRIRGALTATEALVNLAAEARNAGHTLVTDLGTSGLADESLRAAWRATTDDPGFPVRIMAATGLGFGSGGDPEEVAAWTVEMARNGGDKLRFGIVKLILDGSIQGFTARLGWPYYHRPPAGHDGNGLWLVAPEQMPGLVSTFHDAGLTVHCHCNGDEATEVFIDAVQAALEGRPRWDHRHTVQHCQLTTPAQYRRMAALGMHANLFVNHLYYWGDQHRDITVGPERAERMDGCATALEFGVPLSFHSDAPVTPLGHLHTMWCAVNRETATGRVLGAGERISVQAALHAATLGAAAQLRLDHEVGSIETGKLADFAVLDRDPLEVDPSELRDIGVWGTVLGGVPMEADRA